MKVAITKYSGWIKAILLLLVMQCTAPPPIWPELERAGTWVSMADLVFLQFGSDELRWGMGDAAYTARYTVEEGHILHLYGDVDTATFVCELAADSLRLRPLLPGAAGGGGLDVLANRVFVPMADWDNRCAWDSVRVRQYLQIYPRPAVLVRTSYLTSAGSFRVVHYANNPRDSAVWCSAQLADTLLARFREGLGRLSAETFFMSDTADLIEDQFYTYEVGIYEEGALHLWQGSAFPALFLDLFTPLVHDKYLLCTAGE